MSSRHRHHGWDLGLGLASLPSGRSNFPKSSHPHHNLKMCRKPPACSLVCQPGTDTNGAVITWTPSVLSVFWSPIVTTFEPWQPLYGQRASSCRMVVAFWMIPSLHFEWYHEHENTRANNQDLCCLSTTGTSQNAEAKILPPSSVCTCSNYW